MVLEHLEFAPGGLVTYNVLGHLKNHHQRYLQEIVLVRIYKMRFNKVRWQGSLCYFLNEWSTKSR